MLYKGKEIVPTSGRCTYGAQIECYIKVRKSCPPLGDAHCTMHIRGPDRMLHKGKEIVPTSGRCSQPWLGRGFQDCMYVYMLLFAQQPDEPEAICIWNNNTRRERGLMEIERKWRNTPPCCSRSISGCNYPVRLAAEGNVFPRREGGGGFYF